VSNITKACDGPSWGKGNSEEYATELGACTKGDAHHRRNCCPLLGYLHQQGRMRTATNMALDKASVGVRDLPDDDLVALLCATEDEIETHGELNELRELLLDCTMELLRRPVLLRLEMARARDN